MFQIIAQFLSLVSFLRYWKESSLVDFPIILNVIIFCILFNTVSLNIAPLALIFFRVWMIGVGLSLCNPRTRLQLFILISPKTWFLTRNCQITLLWCPWKCFIMVAEFFLLSYATDKNRLQYVWDCGPKIINNIYDASSVPTLPLDTSSVTRGNSFKLSNLRFYHDIRKYAFVPSIINIWNSLPDCVVKVDSIDVFKNRLDKYWSYQDFMFDYTADITGIGHRSEVTVDIDLS